MRSNQNNRDLTEIMRDEMVMKDAILPLLNEKAMTIPEIAEAVGSPRREVTLWIMALWRYGRVVETGSPDESGYCSYRAKE